MSREWIAAVVAFLIAHPVCADLLASPTHGFRSGGDSTNASASDRNNFVNLPDDDCWDPATQQNCPNRSGEGGWVATLRHYQDNGWLSQGWYFGRTGGAGGTSTSLLAVWDPESWRGAPYYTRTTTLSIHINDCDSSIPNATSYANNRQLVQESNGGRADTFTFYYKQPGHMYQEWQGTPCALGQFDEARPPTNPDSIDFLFLQGEFAGDPQVRYDTSIYETFCTGTGYPGCPPDDGVDPPRWEMWMDPGGIAGTYVPNAAHPSAEGYMELAYLIQLELCQRRWGGTLEGCDWNPGRPLNPFASLQSATSTTLTVSLVAGADDGLPIDAATGQPYGVDVYAWLVPDGMPCGNLQNALNVSLPLAPPGGQSGDVTFTGLTPGTAYHVCAMSTDGARPSFGTKVDVSTPP